VDPDNFLLHGCLVRFLQLLERRQKAGGGSDPLAQVLAACLPAHLQNKSAADLNREFLARHEKDLAALLVAGRLMVLLEPGTAAPAAVKLVTRLGEELASRNRHTCLSILEALRAGDFGPEGVRLVEEYRAACSQLFPLAVCFRDPAQAAAASHSSKNSHHFNNHVLAAQVEELSVSS
jgi:hypothetical protein